MQLHRKGCMNILKDVLEKSLLFANVALRSVVIRNLQEFISAQIANKFSGEHLKTPCSPTLLCPPNISCLLLQKQQRIGFFQTSKHNPDLPIMITNYSFLYSKVLSHCTRTAIIRHAFLLNATMHEAVSCALKMRDPLESLCVATTTKVYKAANLK